MLTNAFEIFLRSLAYSFWPFVFILIVLYLINKYFVNRDHKKKTQIQKKIVKTEKESMEHLAEKAINFKTPKIETSFGDRRIGDVHEKKPDC